MRERAAVKRAVRRKIGMNALSRSITKRRMFYGIIRETV